MKKKDLWGGWEEQRRETHSAIGADWRIPKDRDYPFALEYVGPTTGWYMAPPCGAGDYAGVYLIQGQDSNRVKIGYSDYAFRRCAELQTGSPERLTVIAVLDLDRASEKALHERFKPFRIHGEWFSEEILEALSDFPRVF